MICQHGQQARVCELCEKDAEIERLQAKLTETALCALSADGQAHEAWEETQRLRAEVEALRPDAMAYRSMGGRVAP